MAFGIAVIASATATSTTALAGGQAAAKISVEQHEGYMKALSTANAALGKKVQGDQLADAAKDALTLSTTLGDIEKFWAQNNKADGVKWSQDARKTATDLAGALTAGDAAKVKELRTALGQSCTGCHMAYREGGPQTGGYTIKAGVVTP
jgi:cytochrome c556